MKAILISIHEEYVDDIISKKKTLELRTWKPIQLPCLVYICQINKSDNIRNVVAKFILRKVQTIEYLEFMHNHFYEKFILQMACLTFEKARSYLFQNKNVGYGWLITDLRVFPTPFSLSEFNLKSAPQKFVYLRGDLN